MTQRPAIVTGLALAERVGGERSLLEKWRGLRLLRTARHARTDVNYTVKSHGEAASTEGVLVGLDLNPLRRTRVTRGTEQESVRPGLSVVLYTGQPLSQLGPAAAAALLAYLEAIPRDALKSCDKGDDTGPLDSRRISRDIKRLQKPGKNADFFALVYSSSEDRPPADYGVEFLLDEFEEGEETIATLMRFNFPWDSAEGEKTDQFLQTVSAIASKVPFSTGTVGFTFSHWASDDVAVDQVLTMLPRFLGFDHSSDDPRDTLRDLAAGPAWITLLDATLMSDLGGPEACHALAPEAKIDALGSGFMIRAAKLPPVGDITLGAPDLGVMPAIARWLAPRRALFRRLRGSAVELTAASWVARFDALDSRPWDNR